MSKLHHTIWSHTKQAWVAVSEHTRSATKKNMTSVVNTSMSDFTSGVTKQMCKSAAALSLMAFSANAFAADCVAAADGSICLATLHRRVTTSWPPL